ncbi:MAG TPA: SURF1 family protein [Anaerolineales bacterium]
MRFPEYFSRKNIVTTVLVLAGAGLCVRLGIWQLDRLAQRRAFNEHVTTVQQMPMLTLPADGDLKAQEYRGVEVRGTFDFDNQLALRNQVHDGQYGYHLLTPLRVLSAEGAADATSVVLVDRGWIPAAGNELPQDWRRYDVPGEADVVGVIRLAQGPAPLGSLGPQQTESASSSTPFRLYVDPTELSRQLPYTLMPIYVQATGAGANSQAPIAVAPVLDLSEGPHLGYAMQWFGFAVILLIGYVVSRRRQERAEQ